MSSLRGRAQADVKRRREEQAAKAAGEKKHLRKLAKAARAEAAVYLGLKLFEDDSHFAATDLAPHGDEFSGLWRVEVDGFPLEVERSGKNRGGGPVHKLWLLSDDGERERYIRRVADLVG